MRITALLLLFAVLAPFGRANEKMKADLLIVGGNEAAVAAAVQAARLGVERIVLVNDIEWLGGQFSAEGVGAVDEWTIYRNRRFSFPRSGIFLEVMRAIREHNAGRYGVASPGNAVTAEDTIEPAAAERIFQELLAPYGADGSGQVRVYSWFRPIEVRSENGRVSEVVFEGARDSGQRLTVRARLTIDASDWGDVIRLSGARYSAGPDLKSRFGEENAPRGPLGPNRNEMNPITYCLVLREAGRAAPIPAPEGYDPRNYYGSSRVTAEEFLALGWEGNPKPSSARVFVDWAYPEGTYSSYSSIYTHRRLVDRYHNNLPKGAEKILVNWPAHDYPIYNFPQPVVDALEADETGASRKNIVDMTYRQREIVFEDAKRFSLGFLHFLQTVVHEKLGGYPQSFRRMELTDEFGTADRMPWKPYVREGLRLEALYMMREQDIRSQHNVQSEDEERFGRLTWAKVMPPDNVFGFQFNIDFHPTRRTFLGGDRSGPWRNVHTENRNWSTHTDRSGFPYRSLVPVKKDGLLGASKNLGYSSIVSSAVRLHGQMMMTGQAAATAAWICLRDRVEPREIASDWRKLREMQRTLAFGKAGYPGVLLWPYHRLSPDDRWFGAANMLAVRGILPGEPDTLDFRAWAPVTRRELARTLARAAASLEDKRPWRRPERPSYADVPRNDPDWVYIESLADWGVLETEDEAFRPGEAATWKTLYAWLKGMGWRASEGLPEHDHRLGPDSPVLTRAELALHVWHAIKDLPEAFPAPGPFLTPGNDADGDGAPDLEDGLPLDGDNDGLPDRLDPGAQAGSVDRAEAL